MTTANKFNFKKFDELSIGGAQLSVYPHMVTQNDFLRGFQKKTRSTVKSGKSPTVGVAGGGRLPGAGGTHRLPEISVTNSIGNASFSGK